MTCCDVDVKKLEANLYCGFFKNVKIIEFYLGCFAMILQEKEQENGLFNPLYMVICVLNE